MLRRERIAVFVGAVLVSLSWLLVVHTVQHRPPNTPVTNLPTQAVLPTTSPRNSFVQSHETIPDGGLVEGDSALSNLPSTEPVANQIIVQFDADSTWATREALIDSLGGTILNRVDKLSMALVALPATSGTSVETIINSPAITGIEPDYPVSALIDLPTSDPQFDDQWALEALRISDYWLNLPPDAPAVTVAVIDSGICANHEDLVGRVLAGYDFIEDDLIPQDALGHGCGVAGVLAANIDNHIGIAGVAPNVRILPLRVLDAQGIGTYSDVIRAIIQAVDEGAQIINLSLGGSEPSSALESAVQYATARGVQVIAAAGNTGGDVLYPAAYDSVIAVGSIDPDLQISRFSSRGPQVDAFAPGRDILVTMGDDNYVLMSGTSLAAPYVAGIAALEYAQGSPLFVDGGIMGHDDGEDAADGQQVTAQAAFVVDSTADVIDADPGDGLCATVAGMCTLRAAIMETNALPGADMVALPRGTYVLSLTPTNENAALGGDLDILDSLTIQGSGAAVTAIEVDIPGSGYDRAFDVDPTATGITVTLSGITIRDVGIEADGAAIQNNGTLYLDRMIIRDNVATWRGGGIYNAGTLSITNSAIINNRTNNSNGGGIHNAGRYSELTVANTLFRDNQATGTSGGGQGGAIYNAGILTVTNSTFTNNITRGNGSAIAVLDNYARVTLDYVTVAGNITTSSGGALVASGSYGSFTLSNTIVADNWNTYVEPYRLINCVGGYISGGHNLIDGENGCPFATPNSTDLIGVDPLLGDLAYHGGFTETLRLQAGSPAIDAADAAACISTDQRDGPRPAGATCDIGAFEFDADDSGFPPRVASVDTAGGPLIASDELYGYTTDFIAVTFNDDMFDPAGDADADDVTNPANYKLVRAGDDAVLDTAACGPLQGDDTEQIPTSITYANRVATLNFDDPLSGGSYRLLLCGTTTITDIDGNALDGNLDGIGGEDYFLSFRLASVGETPQPGPVFVVNTTEDANDALCSIEHCSLRDAIIASNAWTDSAPVTITVSEGVYNLTLAGIDEDESATGDLDVTADVTITGASAATTIIDGQQLDRVIQIHNGAQVTITDLTLQNGQTLDRDSYYSAYGAGVQILAGNVTLERTIIQDNFTVEAAGGGGIHIAKDGGQLAIMDSIIRRNSAPAAGGLVVDADTQVTITNSAILDNTATEGVAGGILFEFRSNGLTRLEITNSTIANNSAEQGGGIYRNGDNEFIINHSTITGNTSTASGGGLYCVHPQLGTVSIENSIFSGNQGSVGFVDFSGCAVDSASNITTYTDPLLGPLAQNGGFAPTFALLPGSPAIGRGSVNCPATDQRGSARVDGGCDWGGYEATDAAPQILGADLDNTAPPRITVNFSEYMSDPAGDTAANDVTNPQNYRVFSAGPDGVFQSTACGSAQGDDTQVAVDGVVYDNDLRAASLALNGGASLAFGAYQLVACETLQDLDDQALLSEFTDLLYVDNPQIGPQFAVTVTEDVNDGICGEWHCSLREAVIAANRYNLTLDARRITIPAGTYAFSIPGNENEALAGDLDLLRDMVIVGAGPQQTLIDGNQIDRIFHIAAGASGRNVTLAQLTIQNGRYQGSGGGILLENEGNHVLLDHVHVLDNEAGDSGGGIGFWGGTESQLILRNSLVSGNRTTGANSLNTWGRGGGIFNWGVLTIENTTIHHNATNGFGGGILNFGILDATNVTLTDNMADSDNAYGGTGGGIYNGSGTNIYGDFTITNSVIANNQNTAAPDCVGGSSISGSNNLIGSSVACSSYMSTQSNTFDVDPRLGPLADNGGGTRTQALLADSPARDAGDAATCTTIDQRGVPRSICDVGAYEAVDTPFEAIPPIVIGVDLLASSEDVSALKLTFNEALLDPVGDSVADDVTNPTNYQLVSGGGDGQVTTSICGAAQDDDELMVINNVVYDPAFYVATLSVNNEVVLPGGNYRLLACGSTTLRDRDGNALDGNADGTGGDDYLFDFSIELPQPGPTFVVSIEEDTDDGSCTESHCSLREAVIAANDYGDGAIIQIPSGTYVLSIIGKSENAAAQGDLDLRADMTIEGAGRWSTVVNGDRLDRVFDVFADVEIGDLEVLGGLPEQYGDGGGIRVTQGHLYIHDSDIVWNDTDRGSGGGIAAVGDEDTAVSLTVERTRVTSNTADTGAGGGIYVQDVTSAQIIDSMLAYNTAESTVVGGGGLHSENFYLDNHVTISGSTLLGNYAIGGGGVSVRGEGHLDMVNSTLTGNSATYDGGGLDASFYATATLLNVTITENVAQRYNDVGQGGGIAADLDSTINLGNTLIYGNLDQGGEAPDCYQRNSVLSSNDFNLIGDLSGCELIGDTSYNIIGVDPLLLPWDENGGFAVTHALQQSSPAVNAGNNRICPAFDQRGIPRPQGGVCDIGAYELDASEDTAPLVQRVMNGEFEVLTEGATIQTLSTLRIHFSEALQDPVGNSDPDDVTNPANYRLLMTGPDGVFDTLTCTDDPSADVRVPIQVIYDSPTFTAILSPDLTVESGPTDFRLLACGTTTLRDIGGTPLDGNRDGVGGDDYILNFNLTPIQYDTFVVNTAADTDDGLCDFAHCTLREAISAANETVNATIELPAGTYTLALAGNRDDLNATGDLDILAPMTLTGAGADLTIIDGNDLDRVFEMHTGAQSLTLTGITIQNGYGGDGGGIYATGTLTIKDSIVRDNFGADGGGIYLDSGTLTLERTEIANNIATWGGGGLAVDRQWSTLNVLYSRVVNNEAMSNGGYGFQGGGGIASSAVMNIRSSLIAGNHSDDDGGGIYYTPGTDASPAYIINTTISGNTADGSGGGISAYNPSVTGERNQLHLHNTTITDNTFGVYAYLVNIHMQNTILAANRPGRPKTSSSNDFYGHIESEGYNLIGDYNDGQSLGGDPTGNILNVDPLLGPLQDNGGLTLTHNLLPGSPAIDAGNLARCEALDQRDVLRPQGYNCDIGAVEYERDDLFTPLDFAAVPHDPTSIQLTWVDNVAHETGFVIERSPAGEAAWTEIVRVTGAEYLDTDLVCATFYDYRLRAYRENGYSAYAEFLNARTRGCPGSPPSYVEATVQDDDSVMLVWEDNTLTETSFSVERSDGTPDHYHEIGTVSADVTTYHDTSVVPSTVYYYRVRALADGTSTDYSLPATAETPSARQAGPTFTVLTPDPQGGLVCRVDECSLRAAILAANSHAGTDTIGFNLPAPYRLQPVEALPVITDPVVIDGTTQPGFVDVPLVELNGQNKENDRTDGLAISAGHSTVRGLVINHFYGGIVLSENGNNRIVGNYIGTNAAGTSAQPNETGVQIWDGSSQNHIGGMSPQDRNLISGNRANVYLYSGDNLVQGNLIGTDITGTVSLGSITGVLMYDRNTIGGAVGGAGNLISGHDYWGIYVDYGFDYVIQGNYIGTDVTGTQPLGNGKDGIFGDIGSYGRIGGPEPDARNIIANNSGWGINVAAAAMQNNYIGIDVTGTQPLGNALGGIRYYRNENSASVLDSIIAANGGPGIYNSGKTLTIQRSYIGTNAEGSTSLGNQGPGIEGRGPGTIGGTAADANTIAYNQGDGLFLVTGLGQRIQANRIFANAEMGIDLLSDGVNPNDPNDVDTGVNQLQNYPVLTFASAIDGVVTVQGTVNTYISRDIDLDFYANAACDETGYGEGEIYLGRMVIRTDENYMAAFVAALDADIPVGYAITATATTNYGTSEFSACVNTTGLLESPAPELAVESLDNLHVDLSWSPVTDPGYSEVHLERTLSGQNDWDLIAQVSASETTYQDVSPLCDTALQYRMRAFRVDHQYTAYSPPLEAVIICEQLAVAADIQAVANGSRAVDVTWSDTNETETSYEVEFSANAGSNWARLAVLPPDTTTYHHENLRCDRDYSYRVTSRRSIDNRLVRSDGLVKAHTTACVPLNPPVNLVSTALSRTTSQITWENPNIGEVTTFHLERSPDGSAWTEIMDLPEHITAYIDDSLKCGQTYQYRIRAYRNEDSVFSVYSAITSVNLPACPAPVNTTVGLFQNGHWLFWNTNAAGAPGLVFDLGPQESGWLPVTGDWDGDGSDGIALYKNGRWIMREVTGSGLIERVVSFGPAEPGWLPIAGDWNGDDRDGIGLYKDGIFLLRQVASTGSPSMTFTFGPVETGWIPVASDWNHSGKAGVGLYKAGLWLLSNQLPAVADVPPISFGQADWLPVVGDWNQDGVASIGVYYNGQWRLRNSNTSGSPDQVFSLKSAFTGWYPIANYRDGLVTLQALAQPLPDDAPPPTATSTATVVPTVESTVEAWPTGTATVTAEPVDERTEEATSAVGVTPATPEPAATPTAAATLTPEPPTLTATDVPTQVFTPTPEPTAVTEPPPPTDMPEAEATEVPDSG